MGWLRSRWNLWRNKLFEHNICNGTVGVVTKSIDHNNVEVTFPTNENIVKINAQKTLRLMECMPKTRHQFPLQNAFALTVHKTQGLTLPHVTLTIDQNMFAPGQIYVAMSRAPSWDSLDIFDFDFDCLKVDRYVVDEYKRLKLLNERGLIEMGRRWIKFLFFCCE
jgi:ATP-dependent exoDNAse (exonuclease V) alpha subunit